MRFSSSASKPSAICCRCRRADCASASARRRIGFTAWPPAISGRRSNRARQRSRLWQKHILDDAEDDTTRLLFLIKQLLHPLLATLAARHQALVALWLSF